MSAEGQIRSSDRIRWNKAVNASIEESEKKAIAGTKQAQPKPKKKTQKTKSLSQFTNPPIPQVEEEKENENHLLEFVIKVLQRLDPDDHFGKPVDPKKVKYYYEVIKEPMDFGTIKTKIQEGKYKKLEEFEYDVDLISNNAMEFNGPRTVYFKKARAIKKLANKVMDQLRNDPQGLKSKFSLTGSEKGCEGAGTSGTKSCTKRQKRGSSSNSQTGLENPNFENSDTNEPWSTNNPIVTTVYNAAKQLVPVSISKPKYKENGVIGYVESLTQFVRGLGPTAAKVAAQKLAQCFTEPSRRVMQQSRPQGPAHSFIGPDPIIPRRPAGIVIGREAPQVTRGLITSANDKGKGIFVHDGMDRSNSDGILRNTFNQSQMAEGQQREQDDLLLQVFKNQLGLAHDAGPEPNPSLIEFWSRQNNHPRPSVHPSRVIMPSRLSQTHGYTNPLPAPRVEPVAQDSRLLRRTMLMPMPAQLAGPLDLHGAEACREAQTSVNNQVRQGAWQQLGRHDDAGPSSRVNGNSHEEPHRPFLGSNQMGEGAWEQQRLAHLECRFVENPPVEYFRRRRNQGEQGRRDQAGPGGGAGEYYGGAAPQQVQHYPDDLALYLGFKPPQSF